MNELKNLEAYNAKTIISIFLCANKKRIIKRILVNKSKFDWKKFKFIKKDFMYWKSPYVIFNDFDNKYYNIEDGVYFSLEEDKVEVNKLLKSGYYLKEDNTIIAAPFIRITFINNSEIEYIFKDASSYEEAYKKALERYNNICNSNKLINPTCI